ncbi:MAG: CHRD domain-containing protein [Actinobacteria bacterium]|nr:CHRD domain-containing protein [Actinomycetota bacterium]
MGRRYTIALATLTVVGVMAAAFIGPAAAQPVEFTVSLTGGGADQDPDGSGTATISLDAAAGTACFDLAWTRIRGPFAAHIHEGGVGQEGFIVVPLFDMKAGTPLARTIKGVSGCNNKADASVIDAILADPAGFYVNVHNLRFAAGAIRGQLAASTSTTTSTTSPTTSPYP